LILQNWEATLPKFVKVFPHEYKRVLGIPRVPAGVLAAQAGTETQGQVVRG
jgi:glutamate synthase domain-containing protein 3